ncbi:MAG: nucleotidyltransferase family protein [Hyphomicrobiaceae bacterium]
MDATLDLRSDLKPVANRDEVLARLRSHEAEFRGLLVTALHLYGSAARDAMTAESDVDLFIDYDPEGPFSFVELIRGGELAKEILGRDVDYGSREGLRSRLRKEIESSSIKVF